MFPRNLPARRPVNTPGIKVEKVLPVFGYDDALANPPCGYRPMHDRHDDRIEIEALLRHDIFVALLKLGSAPTHG